VEPSSLLRYSVERMGKRLSQRRKRKTGWASRLRWWALWLASLWFISVVLLRFIAPPTTPLIVIRAVEYWLQGKSVSQKREWIALDDVPTRVQQAIVAAEDARFMRHWGVDFGALDDVLDDATDSRRVRGASTITMQTVKNIYLWPGRSYVRKVLEGVMTPIAGVVWGKRRTLELYLNIVEWGEGVYGISAASHHYFQKSVRELSLDQASALAAILPSPRVLTPHTLSPIARKRFARIRKEAHDTRLPGLR
jgi:monofunctional biosynthetic peptidoglycan transglycosylase